MPRLRITLLTAACLIAVAVACSSSDTSTSQQPEPQEAPTSTLVTSARAQPTAPAPTTGPAPTAPPPPTAAAASTSTSVPATTAPTSAPAPTAPPTSVATSDASAPATVTSEDGERDLKIVTLLPFDAIPAILEPEFIDAEEADAQLEPQSLVLGLSINDDHRAYSIPTLSAHEIVNDTVGGKPIAVTW